MTHDISTIIKLNLTFAVVPHKPNLKFRYVGLTDLAKIKHHTLYFM